MPQSAEGHRAPFVTGLVLAAGGSSRLGQPKQLLPYGGGTLLDHTLSTARDCGFDQLIVALGGSSEEVRRRVDLSGVETVDNRDFGEGCSSSIAAALGAVDERAQVLVLMLGDQPGVTAETVESLLLGRPDGAKLTVCRYDDGRARAQEEWAAFPARSPNRRTRTRFSRSPCAHTLPHRVAGRQRGSREAAD